ncbi:hypothetical protein GOBAR_AA27152 [Gossypium barbadense]|uniref:Transposase MuDR plant domain-containing protein n=1 Tax=Gossypium barbadense TaxID=3634 RepID=A0A2P5WQZ7_GOSBA|nr:hypothetical protein GOBAR_AA27152 [Gossypium barbadense]
MPIEEEYYMNLYVVGKFVHDPHVKCSGGEMMRLKEDPDTISYFELCKIVKQKVRDNLRAVWNDSSTINMLNYYVKHNEINLYVEHEIDTTIFSDDDLILLVATVAGTGDGNESVEVAGNKGGKGVEGLNGKGVKGGEGGEVKGGKGGKGVEGLNREGVDVDGSKGGEGVEGLGGEGVDIIGNEGGKGGEGGEGVEGLDCLDVSIERLEESDGGLNSGVEEAGEEGVEDESDSDSKYENVYLINVREVEGETNGKAKETILDETKSESSREQRELKIIKNELNRVRVKCIASNNNMSRCMQVKIFHDEHNCCVSFRNKIANVKVIVNNFEATIKDHPKMKLRKMQRRVASEIHINVNMTRCRRAKKMVKDKLQETLKKAKAFEFTFWKIVKSTTKKKWEQKKEELYKINEGFAKELFSKNSKAWTKAFQWLHSVSDIVDNNLYVAFNSSMVESKFKSIITMLEEIIVKMMTRIVDKRKQRSSWKYNYDLLIKKKFDDIKKEGVDWKIIWNGENRCEVKKGRKQYIVNVEDKTSCC